MRIIFFYLIAISLVACQNENTTNTTTASADSTAISNATPIRTDIYTKTYKGTIAEDIDITLQLVISGTQIRGGYFYDKYEEILPIRGSLSKDGFIQLAVYDITTETTEYFQGEFLENDNFKGQWFKTDAGASKYNFELTPYTFEPTFTHTDLRGMYALVSGELISTIAIDTTTLNNIHFQTILSYVHCTGDVEGYAWYHTPTKAIFYGEEGCYMVFDISKEKIQLVEESCQYYHGFKCNFSGDYVRASMEVEWVDFDNLDF